VDEVERESKISLSHFSFFTQIDIPTRRHRPVCTIHREDVATIVRENSNNVKFETHRYLLATWSLLWLDFHRRRCVLSRDLGNTSDNEERRTAADFRDTTTIKFRPYASRIRKNYR